MYRVQLATKILIQLVSIERCKRSQQLGDCHQTSIKCLISRELILTHLLTPETFAVQTNEPVTQVVVDESIYQSACTCGIVSVELSLHTLDESVQARENPTVDLWTLVECHLCCSGVETIHIGIERKETISVIQRAEELTTHLVDALGVELQIVPRFRVGHHIQTDGITTVLADHIKRIHHVTHVLRHLVTFGIEHETRRNHILKGYRVEDHRSDGMQGEEPTTRLVDTLVDKVTGEGDSLVNQVLILKRIVYLSVRHRARIEPNVDEVALTLHGLTALRNEDDMIHIGTMEINLVVVLLRHVARHKAFILQWIRLHESNLNRLLDLVIEFLYGANADLLAILVAPDRKGCAPET